MNRELIERAIESAKARIYRLAENEKYGVGEASDMDEDMIEACEECESNAEQLDGQMDITDFPEVLP